MPGLSLARICDDAAVARTPVLEILCGKNASQVWCFNPSERGRRARDLFGDELRRREKVESCLLIHGAHVFVALRRLAPQFPMLRINKGFPYENNPAHFSPPLNSSAG